MKSAFLCRLKCYELKQGCNFALVDYYHFSVILIRRDEKNDKYEFKKLKYMPPAYPSCHIYYGFNGYAMLLSVVAIIVFKSEFRVMNNKMLLLSINIFDDKLYFI